MLFCFDISAQNLRKDSETLPQDSIATNQSDSLLVKKDSLDIPIKMSNNSLNARVTYKAKDSIVYDITNKKIYLYNRASISQDDMELEAATIVFDQEAKIVRAEGKTDTLGRAIGTPKITEGGRNYEAAEIEYNFESKKGKLSHIVTKEGEGYLRGEKVKKNERDELFAQNAFYTTCALEHPHFKIKVDKVKIVPNKLIVSGPAQLEIADVPTPLVLPFAIFPIQKQRSSGIILPSYGYSPNRGYYLQGGGYYFGFSDFVDLALIGDIYTNGSWRANGTSVYRKRYKFNGNVSIDFGRTREGDPITPDFQVRDNFRVGWTHSQDAKARPNSSFSANVNFASSGFNREYGISNDAVLTNTITSSISFRQNIQNTPFNYTLNARHEQNTNTNKVNLTLPSFTLNMNRIQPFKRKIKVGKDKWFEKVNLTYSMDAQARTSVTDSLLFTNSIFDELRYGLNHKPVISTNFKILKYINVQPSVNYSEAWYFETTRKVWVGDTILPGETIEIPNLDQTLMRIASDTLDNEVYETTVGGFQRAMQFGGGLNMSTTLYGMFNFRKGRVKAIRHELRPTVGFNTRPDFEKAPFNYYRSYVKNGDNDNLADNDTITYSIFENGIYGSPARGSQASLTFGFANNLQMKIRPAKNDTSTTDRKINLLDRFAINSSYNFLADSLNLANINISGGTNLFNKININFNTIFDPYITDDSNRSLNRFEWTENKRLARFKTAQITLRTDLSSDEIGKGKSLIKNANQSSGRNSGAKVRDASSTGSDNTAEREEINNYSEQFDNWDIPWKFGVDYTLNLRQTKQNGIDTLILTQNLGFNTTINLTRNWRVTVTSAYDFVNKELARTTINLNRDLHCWEMLFNIVPNGAYQNYSFELRVKSSVLQDLKLSRKRRWQDL